MRCIYIGIYCILWVDWIYSARRSSTCGLYKDSAAGDLWELRHGKNVDIICRNPTTEISCFTVRLWTLITTEKTAPNVVNENHSMCFAAIASASRMRPRGPAGISLCRTWTILTTKTISCVPSHSSIAASLSAWARIVEKRCLRRRSLYAINPWQRRTAMLLAVQLTYPLSRLPLLPPLQLIDENRYPNARNGKIMITVCFNVVDFRTHFPLACFAGQSK